MGELKTVFARANLIFYLVLSLFFAVPCVSMGSEENKHESSESDQASVALKQAKDDYLDQSQAGVRWYLLLPTFILILVGGISWFWLRSRGTLLHGTGPVKLIQVLALGQRNRLFVVRYEDTEILIAETPNNISLLYTKPRGTD